MATTLDGAKFDDPDGSNLLVLAPSPDPADDEACAHLLTIAPVAEGNVLSIAIGQSPDERFRVWRTHADGELAANATIVSAGESTRSAAVESAARDRQRGTIRVETVADPGDLTGIGIEITKTLDDWEADDRIVVCLHSITALLEHVSLERVFQFLQVMSGQLKDAGAVSHYHMDPTVADERAINVIKSIVDAVVELDEDGNWTVTSR